MTIKEPGSFTIDLTPTKAPQDDDIIFYSGKPVTINNVNRALWERFKIEAQTKGMTQSELLNRILSQCFNMK